MSYLVCLNIVIIIVFNSLLEVLLDHFHLYPSHGISNLWKKHISSLFHAVSFSVLGFVGCTLVELLQEALWVELLEQNFWKL